MADKIIKEHEFITHRKACSPCQSVDIAKPATLVNCCLQGAPLLRAYLNFLAAPAARKQNAALKRQFTQEADGKNYHTSKQKLKEVMRYK